MIWLTWRQFRTPAVIGFAVAAYVAARRGFRAAS